MERPNASVSDGPFESASPASKAVHQMIEWLDGDNAMKLSARWLRLECPCGVCRVEQTAERRWLPIGVGEFSAQAVQHDEGGILIDWESGHRSQFSADQIRAALGSDRRGRSDLKLWVGGAEPRRFDHDLVCGSAAERGQFLTVFRDEGVAILTGTPSTPGQVEITMPALGLPLRETFSERVHNVRVDPAGYNIAHTAEGLPPHSDYPSYSHPPSGQVLHMLINDCEGGLSLVVDGWNVAELLRAKEPELFDLLAAVPVGFRQYSSDRESFARSPLIRLGVDGEVVGFRYSNQLMQPLNPSDPRFEDWLDAYLLLTEMLSNIENQRRFRLSAGDALFVHGHRVLHGRTEFVASGPRFLQDCYFDFDDVLAGVDRLSGLAVAK